jgi:RNA polymerase sigma factor (sigma-70 family)
MERSHLPLSDAEVLRLLTDNKTITDAIRHLYQTYAGSLNAFVTSNNGSREDAQDTFQEVMVAFINLVKQQKFRGESSIKTFLFSMNRNIWFNELKRRGRATEREKRFGGQGIENEEAIDQAIESMEAHQQLLKLMSALGESCKKILLLYYYENYSMKELLTQLEYENEQVVRNKKYKCLKKLEEMIRSQKGLFQQLKSLLHG